jgi:hypothetical protein
MLGMSACVNGDKLLEKEDGEIRDEEVLYRASDIEIEANTVALYSMTRSHNKLSLRQFEAREKRSQKERFRDPGLRTWLAELLAREVEK